jgi:hypothetical protein
MVGHIVSRYPSVRKHWKEDVRNVVTECSAVCRIGRWPTRIVGKKVRQQSLRHPSCLRKQMPSRMLQGVSEDRHKASIIGRFSSEVGALMLSGQEYRLRWSRTASA